MGTPSRIAIGPEDYYLTAIITLPKNEFEHLKKLYKNNKDSTKEFYWSDRSLRDWYTDGVKRKLVREGKFYRVKGPIYEAKTFGGFYIDKYCFFTDDNEIFLTASTR